MNEPETPLGPELPPPSAPPPGVPPTFARRRSDRLWALVVEGLIAILPPLLAALAARLANPNPPPAPPAPSSSSR